MNEIHQNLPAIKLEIFTVADWVILSILLLGISIILWKIFYKEKIKEEIKTLKIKKFIPEKFIFSEELNKLEKLKQTKKWKEFSLYATKILKKQLENKYKKAFAFATGKEVEEILKEDIPTTQNENIKRFFYLLSPIKFAKKESDISDEILNLLNNFEKYFNK